MDEKKEDKIIKRIPENYEKTIEEAQKKIGEISNNFIYLSTSIVRYQSDALDIYKKLIAAEKHAGNVIKSAFKKMKLHKDKIYEWKFDGKNNFIGQVKNNK